MVDLTRDEKGKVHPRLLDLVPGRSGPVLKNWLDAQGTAFISGIALAAIDPFAGYKSALDATLDDDAVLVLDAFHVVALGTKALDEVRRRVQQATTGHRGRKGDQIGRASCREGARIERARATQSRQKLGSDNTIRER